MSNDLIIIGLFLFVNSLIIFIGYRISEISKLLSLCIFMAGFTLYIGMRLFKLRKFNK